MIEKLECTCREAYRTRKLRDPSCCACSCDHNNLVEQLAKANERVRELERDSVSDKVSAIKDAFKYAEIKSKNWFQKQFDTTPIEYRDGIDCMVAFLDEYAEQLRKEQNK